MGKNKGLTLIELVTSLGILAIVSLVVVGFISIASKTFRSVNTEVNLQYEAQLTINQLKDLIVDSNRGIVYGLDPIVGDFTQVDMETTGAELAALQSLEAADNMNVGTIKRCILIYNANFLTATNTYEYPVIKIQWDPVTKVLSYTEKVFLTLADLEADQYLETVPSTDYSIMSDYMEGFQVSSMDGEKKLLNMRIALDSEGKNYEASPSVSLRNKVSTDGDIGVIYGGDPVVRPSLVEQVQIEKAGVVVTADTVEVGNQVQYSANVKLQFGANDSMRGVQWTLTGNSTYGTGSPSSISQTGLLTVSTYELSSQLICTATSLADPSKKAVLIITVDNSRGEFGYVSGVSLGEVLYGDIAAASAPGGPYAYYGIDYNNTNTYITYVNEDKLTAAEKGVTWQVITNAPAGSYEVGQIPAGAVSYGLQGKSPIYIKAYYAAMGYEFQIKATSKADNYEGNKISVMRTFLVSGLQEPLVELQPVLNINFSSTNLSRNGFITASSDIQNVVQPVVQWSIDYSGDSDFSESNTRRSKSNVYREDMSDGSQKIFAKSQLDWNREFTCKLRMQVTGLTNKGNPVNQIIERTITIPVVRVMVTPNTQSITYGSDAVSIPTSYTFSNLNIGSAGFLDPNLNPGISFDQIVYSYQVRKWNGSLSNRTYDLRDSDITYNQVTKNIMLTQSLMSDIDWIRSDGTNSLDFLMVFTYSGNKITYPIQYVFHK